MVIHQHRLSTGQGKFAGQRPTFYRRAQATSQVGTTAWKEREWKIRLMRGTCNRLEEEDSLRILAFVHNVL